MSITTIPGLIALGLLTFVIIVVISAYQIDSINLDK